MSINESFVSTDSSSEPQSFVGTPPVTIRRPLNMLLTPTVPDPNSSPYPRESPAAPVSPFQIATPVIITPIDVRSTREIVRVNRIRRVRRRQEAGVRSVLAGSVRRRLSLANITRVQLNTPTTLPRSKPIDKTRTAIELEQSFDGFEKVLSDALLEVENSRDSSEEESTKIPSESSTSARLRELNRLEAMEVATMSLEAVNTSESEILEALALLEWNLQLMNSETLMIDEVLNNFEAEKRMKEAKWKQIELIMNLLKED